MMRPIVRDAFRAIVAVAASAALAHAVPQRTIAIGDVHGEHEGFVSILKQAGLVDDELRWSGGDTILVQTGDFLDRGQETRKVMDLLMALERQAPRGQVVVLLGNHDAMDLTGVLTDVNPLSYAAFADRKSEKRRAKAYRRYAALHRSLAKRYPDVSSLEVMSEAAWMEAHPPGYLEYLDALGPRGKYGRWLRKRPVIAKVGQTLFVHGGVNPGFQPMSVKRINDQAHLEMEALDRIREYLIKKRLILPFFSYTEIVNVLRLEAKRIDSRPDPEMVRFIDIFNGVGEGSLFHHDGPLWFRGFSDWSEEDGERRIESILEAFGVRRIVVGHVFGEDASDIRSRFGGKVYLIDTAMLRGYGINGRPSALEISGDDVTAIYETGRVGLEGTPKREGLRFLLIGPKGATLPFRSRGEVVGFLRDARLRKAKAGELHGITKPTKVLVEHEGTRAHAVFRCLHREEPNAYWEDGTFTELLRDTWEAEIAAYELSVLLGLDTVPPTVRWEMDGRAGSLQIFIEQAHKGWHPEEPERPPDPSWWQMEIEKLRVFDALIRNTDRHVRNMLVDANRVVWWIDHTRAFGREHELLHPEEIQRCERQLWQRLQDLDPQLVATRMAPYMGPQEIAALLARQEGLIRLLEQRIRERGEAMALFTIEPNLPRRAEARTDSSSDR